MKLTQMSASQNWRLLLIVLISSAAFAQERKDDLIVKRDSSKISVRLLVVSDQTVQYKKASDLNGPVFNILKSEIARIIYGNGETEVFQKTANRVFYDNQEPMILYTTAPWRAPGFQDNLSVWTPDELKSASNFYTSNAKKSKTISVVFMSAGAAIATAGIILLSTRDPIHYSAERTDQGVAGVVAGLGVGVVGGLLSNGKTKKFQRNATWVEQELSKRKVSLNRWRIHPSVNPFNKSASASFAFQF